MRWPWQKRKPDPVEDEIAELMVEHRKTLARAGRALSDRSAQIMEHYERADRERRQ